MSNYPNQLDNNITLSSGSNSEFELFGNEGESIINLSGSSHTLSNEENKSENIKVTGTGSNTIILTASTSNATSYKRYIWNAGSGNLTINDSNLNAPSAVLAPGKGAMFLFSVGAVKQLTAAFTVA